MSEVIPDGETKTTWRMPRELHKDLKRYALENDTNVTAVVLKACREFLSRDKAFEDKYKSHSGLVTTEEEILEDKEIGATKSKTVDDLAQLPSDEEILDEAVKEVQGTKSGE